MRKDVREEPRKGRGGRTWHEDQPFLRCFTAQDPGCAVNKASVASLKDEFDVRERLQRGDESFVCGGGSARSKRKAGVERTDSCESRYRTCSLLLLCKVGDVQLLTKPWLAPSAPSREVADGRRRTRLLMILALPCPLTCAASRSVKLIPPRAL